MIKGNRFLKYTLITIVLFAVYVGIISVTPLISNRYLDENIYDACQLLKTEGLYLSYFGNTMEQYDNFTDSLYLNIMNNHGLTGKGSFYEGIANYVRRPEKAGQDEIDALELAISEKDSTKLGIYSNYWLGILLPLKIILSVLKWNEIRYLLYVLGAVCSVYTFCLIWKKVDGRAAIAYAIACILLCVNHQTSDVVACVDFLMTHIALCYYINHRECISPYFYFLVGSLQFFLSFLYAPIRVVGMLLVFCVIMDYKKGEEKKRANKNLCMIAVFWTMGYGLTNLFKQLLAKLFLDTTQGIDKLVSWSTSSLVKKVFGFGVPAMRMIGRYTFWGIIVVVLVFFVLYIKGKLRFEYNKKIIVTGCKAMFVAFFPMWIWCFILSEAIHHGFYVQNYMPFIVAFFYMVASGIELTDSAQIMKNFTNNRE